MSSPDEITLESSDRESFKVEKALALQFGKIRQKIEQKNFDAKGIPLPNVTGKILSKVIEYCKRHVVDTDCDSSVTGNDLEGWDAEVGRAAVRDLIQDLSKALAHEKMHVLEDWDAEFVKVDQTTLFDLALAAYNLNIKGLLDLTARTVADKIKETIPKDPNMTFNIRNEYTAEEEEEIRRENHWKLD